jgi:two-component system, OmpR family, sensor histidine kinase KdpD
VKATPLIRLAGTLAAVAAVTAVVAVVKAGVPVLSLGVLYLFAILPVSLYWGRVWGLASAVVSMLAFNFFFLPPRYTFELAERTNWLALAVYSVTALVVSDLAGQARRRAAEAEQREREEALLSEVSLALLQGEHVTEQLDELAAATARVLQVPSARMTLGEAEMGKGETVVPLEVGKRRVGLLFLPADAPRDHEIEARFLPALASLVAITLDRGRLEQEALEAERLRISDSVKTTILRAVSHDLRSPLTAIRVAAESLASPSVSLDEPGRERQLDTILAAARRLERLVANLLDLSRLQAGAAVPRRALVPVDELVGQALASAGADEGRAVVLLPDDVPLVEVDAVQVERALGNVVENALAFSPAGEVVRIEVSATAAEVVLRIVDGGPGIPAGDLERVFEPFERADGSERAGAGLGLSIARGFAEANGGRLWAEPGPGGALVLALPRAALSEAYA